MALNNLKPSEASITRALLAAYTLSNKCFPQTRFYFVIDFCRRLTPEGFRHVRASGLTVPPNPLRRLAKFGTVEHAGRRITRTILPCQTEADIRKMMQAVNDVFSAYLEMHESPETCVPEFLMETGAMKTRIDQLGASEGYLDFISPPGDARGAAMVRSENTYLRGKLIPALGTSALARALEPQVVRPVWVRR